MKDVKGLLLGMVWCLGATVFWAGDIDSPAAVGPLADVAPVETVNVPLPPGWYTFYLTVDDQINAQPDLTWIDSVEVEVE